MKKTHTVRTFLAGVLAALLLVGMVPPALAAAGMNITIYPGISVYMDDQKLEPKDANGNPVMMFTYNGTTYLPVRAISEALGKPVQWDGKTQSVYVGKHNSDKPAAWLSQMDYFSGTNSKSFKTAATEQDNTGTVHANCITQSFERSLMVSIPKSPELFISVMRCAPSALLMAMGAGSTSMETEICCLPKPTPKAQRESSRSPSRSI